MFAAGRGAEPVIDAATGTVTRTIPVGSQEARQPLRGRLVTTWDVQFRALPGIPLIEPGDDLPVLIAKAAQADGFTFADGDVAVVAQKVVSKAEGRIVRLDEVKSRRSQEGARLTDVPVSRAPV